MTNPDPNQNANQPLIAPSITKLSPAYELMFEDCLKSIVQKATTGKTYNSYKNKYCPKAKHSAFGDFPPEYMPSKMSTQPTESQFELLPSPESRIYLEAALKKGMGIGGKTSSLLPKKEKIVEKPKKAGATNKRIIPSSEFRKFYDRGDLPISVMHSGSGAKLFWKNKPANLDYHHFLPKFFDGIREKQDPYRFLAIQGTIEMLEHGGAKILPVIPQLIIPIKSKSN